jgi:hypothetical protein
MFEKMIIFIFVILLIKDFSRIKQDKKSKRVYMVVSIPAIYLLFSFTFGKNLPNLDELFQFTLGPLAETILSWFKVK